MNTPEEKLSLIAADFPLAVDPLEGERGAYARQRVKDVLAGHPVHVVSIEAYTAAQEKGAGLAVLNGGFARDAVRTQETIAKLTADNAALRAAVVHAEDTFDRYARHHRDNGSPEKATHNEWHRDKMTAVLEKGGAGWVSPEEHARVVFRVRMLESSLEETHDNAAKARARLAEVEAARKIAGPFSVIEERGGEGDWKIVGIGDTGIREVFGECSVEAEAHEIVSRLNRYEAAEANLARVKAEAEGLRAFGNEARLRRALDVAIGEHAGEWLPTKKINAAVADVLAALASPTPSQGADISATSVMLKGGAP